MLLGRQGLFVNVCFFLRGNPIFKLYKDMCPRIEFGLLGAQSLKSVSFLVLWFFARVPKIIYLIMSRFKRILTIYFSTK